MIYRGRKKPSYRHSPQAAASLSAYGRIVNTMIVLPYVSLLQLFRNGCHSNVHFRPFQDELGRLFCQQGVVKFRLNIRWKFGKLRVKVTEQVSPGGVCCRRNPSVAAGPSNGDGDSLSASP